MTEVKVEQCDQDAAEELFGLVHLWRDDGCDHLRSLASDKSAFVAAFARHRQAAEKAQQERDAAYIEGRVEHYQAKIDKTNPDDVDLIEMRQHTVEALEVIATAIRSQGHE